MRRSFFIVFLIPSLAAAGGPKYSFSDAKLNNEFDNVYHDIKNVANGTYKSSSMTLQGITASSATITHLLGTTTNDNATAGTVGEYVSSVAGYSNFPTSGQYGDLTSISLTAGDWDVTVVATLTENSSTISLIGIGVSAASGNDSTGLVRGNNYIECVRPYNTNDVGCSVPNVRVSISATTTYYFKYVSSYTSGPPQAKGRISARRVR
jgi:hypothetical protein